MINRNHIESLLRSNGVAINAPDEEIRSVLLSARYEDEEVDTAILVLRENTKTNQTRVDGLHKIFRSNQALLPQEISQLLGIDVSRELLINKADKIRNISLGHLIIVFVVSVVVVGTVALLYMYLFKMGVFTQI